MAERRVQSAPPTWPHLRRVRELSRYREQRFFFRFAPDSRSRNTSKEPQTPARGRTRSNSGTGIITPAPKVTPSGKARQQTPLAQTRQLQTPLPLHAMVRETPRARFDSRGRTLAATPADRTASTPSLETPAPRRTGTTKRIQSGTPETPAPLLRPADQPKVSTVQELAADLDEAPEKNTRRRRGARGGGRRRQAGEKQ